MKALRVVAAYSLWLVNALFGVWLLYISRNTWLAYFNQYYINGSPTQANRAMLMDRIFSILLGFIWFALVIFFESYFKNSVVKGDLMRRFAKGTSPLVLAIFGVDFILALIQGLANVGSLRLIIMLIELVLGIVLVRLGWFKTISSIRAGQAKVKD